MGRFLRKTPILGPHQIFLNPIWPAAFKRWTCSSHVHIDCFDPCAGFSTINLIRSSSLAFVGPFAALSFDHSEISILTIDLAKTLRVICRGRIQGPFWPPPADPPPIAFLSFFWRFFPTFPPLVNFKRGKVGTENVKNVKNGPKTRKPYPPLQNVKNAQKRCTQDLTSKTRFFPNRVSGTKFDFPRFFPKTGVRTPPN